MEYTKSIEDGLMPWVFVKTPQGTSTIQALCIDADNSKCFVGQNGQKYRLDQIVGYAGRRGGTILEEDSLKQFLRQRLQYASCNSSVPK